MASSDENGGGLEEDEVDEGGLNVTTLERFDKTVPVSAWYVKILLRFVMNDSECNGKFKAQSDLKHAHDRTLFL